MDETRSVRRSTTSVPENHRRSEGPRLPVVQKVTIHYSRNGSKTCFSMSVGSPTVSYPHNLDSGLLPFLLILEPPQTGMSPRDRETSPRAIPDTPPRNSPPTTTQNDPSTQFGYKTYRSLRNNSQNRIRNESHPGESSTGTLFLTYVYQINPSPGSFMVMS